MNWIKFCLILVINPKLIEVSPPSSTSNSIDQSIVKCNIKNKLTTLENIFSNIETKNTLIFCNRKKEAENL